MMTYPGSLHCHTHRSNFRLRDCIIKEEDLINRAIELNQSVVAVTDHETVSSAIKVEEIKEKVKDKIKIIMGNEIYLCRNGLTNENFIPGEDKYYHFILLAKDAIGFKQICELSTRAWDRSYMARGMRRVPTYYSDLQEIIGKNPGHVIGSSACLGGMLGTQLIKVMELESKDSQEAAQELYKHILDWCKRIAEIFGGKDYFYLEMQPSDSKEQTYVNNKILQISKETGLDYIITCDVHYLQEKDRSTHKAYLNASEGDREVDAFYATTYLINTEELENRLDLTREELESGFRNILKIQNLCEDYSIKKVLKIPTLKWNNYNHINITQEWLDRIPYFKTFLQSDYIGDKELVKAIIDGINKHPDLQNEKAYEEINNNLETTWISSNVNKAHWSAYYLNLQKIIDLCWEAGSLVGPGRGSGVGFILLYCLGITQINPLLEDTKTFSWRFLNPDRVSVLDIDFDIETNRRQQVLKKFREFYGEDRVANVLTLRTEKSKSAILTAARGMGNIDVDVAQYLASLIPSDRGQLRTLKETFYGDIEKGFKPVTAFVNEMTNNYPELWEIAQKIEGLICGTGIHAGGVIFVDEPFTESSALMRAPDGTIITQFDLHESEKMSLIKYDALSVDAMDKIHVCLDLLLNDNLIEKKDTLKETYENAIGIYNLERTNPKMWEMVWNHKILNLFQMEQQSGIRGISLAKPQSVQDLAHLNSVIRLMAQEKGGELPLEKYSRFKEDITLWFDEMNSYGLTKEEQEVLKPIVGGSYGICEAQEQFMQLVQLKECGGYNLNWADKLRKAIAKKNPAGFEELEKEFYENIKTKNLSYNFCNYVWKVLVSTSKGYGFNLSHTLSYSLIALQEMNLAFRFPLIYWNCACLICNSGSVVTNDEDIKGTDYGKMAKAIGEVIQEGIKISLIDINHSNYSFVPDVKNNTILFGLKGVNKIGDPIIDQIIANRPYTGIIDFMNKCPLNKTAMVSLIQAGAFDELDKEWAIKINPEPRVGIMSYYISQVCGFKNKLTLVHFNELMKMDLLPESLSFQKRLYTFNKYLKDNQKVGKYYVFDNPCLIFYEEFFELDMLEIINGYTCILQTKWDKIYKNNMDKAREWLKENQEELLKKINQDIFKKAWNKYASDTISAWEMNSVCFYFHEHELSNIDKTTYGLSDFGELSTEPEIQYTFRKGGKEIPIFKTHKIIGTVIAKDDLHSSITLLTTSGVATVKFSKEYYANFNKQISEKQEDGTKKVMEKSCFTRGTKVMVTGFRRENTFIAKSYKHTPTHQFYRITEINGKDMNLEHERYQPQD